MMDMDLKVTGFFFQILGRGDGKKKALKMTSQLSDFFFISPEKTVKLVR